VEIGAVYNDSCQPQSCQKQKDNYSTVSAAKDNYSTVSEAKDNYSTVLEAWRYIKTASSNPFTIEYRSLEEKRCPAEVLAEMSLI